MAGAEAPDGRQRALLDEPREVTSVRNMLGYTGTYAFANVLLMVAGSLILMF